MTAIKNRQQQIYITIINLASQRFSQSTKKTQQKNIIFCVRLNRSFRCISHLSGLLLLEVHFNSSSSLTRKQSISTKWSPYSANDLKKRREKKKNNNIKNYELSKQAKMHLKTRHMNLRAVDIFA